MLWAMKSAWLHFISSHTAFISSAKISWLYSSRWSLSPDPDKSIATAQKLSKNADEFLTKEIDVLKLKIEESLLKVQELKKQYKDTSLGLDMKTIKRKISEANSEVKSNISKLNICLNQLPA